MTDEEVRVLRSGIRAVCDLIESGRFTAALELAVHLGERLDMELLRRSISPQ